MGEHQVRAVPVPAAEQEVVRGHAEEVGERGERESSSSFLAFSVLEEALQDARPNPEISETTR